MIFGAVVAMLVVAAIIAGSVIVLIRTGGGARVHDRRVVGPPIPGEESSQHERDTALMNLTIMNQQATLMENQRSFGG